MTHVNKLFSDMASHAGKPIKRNGLQHIDTPLRIQPYKEMTPSTKNLVVILDSLDRFFCQFPRTKDGCDTARELVKVINNAEGKS